MRAASILAPAIALVASAAVSAQSARPMLDYSTAATIRDTCLAWNGVICQSCLGRCPARALVINRARQLHIDTTLCNGCGMCISACPVDALKIAGVAST